MNAIEVTGLSKSYKDKIAVDNITFNIKKGDFFALLGQNGAGKTTTIKMLSCLLSPTSGDALILGNSITSHPESIKKIINVSPQETAIAPNLSVKENLELIAQIYGFDKDKSRFKTKEMMLNFSLTDRSNDKAKTLSGGLQRRLSIAMALISNPQILFLDEPTLGLDVRARRELWKIINNLKGKITIILTTHYLEEAEALADNIGIMQVGKLKALGTLEEIKKTTGKDNLEDAFLMLTEKEAIL